MNSDWVLGSQFGSWAIGCDMAPTGLFKIVDIQIQPIIDYSSEVCNDGKVNRRLESQLPQC